MIVVVLSIVSIFFACNMGISGFSVAFTPSYGSAVLKKHAAVILYGLAVLAGGTLIGPRVIQTLTSQIMTQRIDPVSGLIILTAAGITLFVSNVLKIPQSTSFVTVASFVGSGLFYDKVHWGTIAKILIVAVVFSAISFFLTFWIIKKIYPPAPGNLKFYEFFHVRRPYVKKFIIVHDIYSAFGIGTNNVANVVAPVVAALAVPSLMALGAGALFFAIGAYFFGERVIRTVSQQIIPLGEISATVVSLMTASLVIGASMLGLPAPYVQFTTFAVLAVSCAKDGVHQTFRKDIFKKIVFVWMLVPLATVVLSYLLHVLFVARLGG